MTGLRGALAIAAAALALAACATPQPIVVSADSLRPAAPPARTASRPPPKPGATPAAVCKVRVAAIVDRREQGEAVGEIGLRPVQGADVQAWVRTSLETLTNDPRIALVAAPGDARLELNVEILKAYVQSQTTAKSVNVVLRIRYAPTGDEQVYRGRDDSMNWISGAGETNSAINHALGRLTDDIRADVLRRCGVAGPDKKR